MGKKVLVLSGSPRRGGNSDLLCDQFMSGAISSGHQVEKIFLKDKNINYCSGCGLCINRQGVCSQKDDMEAILDKMIESDVIVMATPIYFYTMAGQMKTLIDRTCARYTRIKDKEFYFIMTAADADKKAMDRALIEFQGFTYCLSGAKEKGTIYGTGVWNTGEIKDKKAMTEAYEMGRNI